MKQPRQLLSVELHSVSSARDWMNTICGPHKLEVNRPRELLFTHQGTSLPDISIGIIQYSTKAHIKTADLEHSYSISLPLTGQQYMEHQKKEINSNTISGLIISPSDQVKLTMSEDCQKRLVRISRTLIEKKLSQVLHKPIYKPVIFEPSISLEHEMRDWWVLVDSLQIILKQQHSLLDFSDIWSSMQDTLITSLLYTQPHNYSDDLAHILKQRPAYLVDLELILKAHLDQPLAIKDFERLAGVSREKLYRDFREYYHCAPMEYFRTLRFEKVHTRLAQAQSLDSVSSIAMEYGFTQLGRFAHEYHTRFGELPSETLYKAQQVRDTNLF